MVLFEMNVFENENENVCMVMYWNCNGNVY